MNSDKSSKKHITSLNEIVPEKDLLYIDGTFSTIWFSLSYPPLQKKEKKSQNQYEINIL